MNKEYVCTLGKASTVPEMIKELKVEEYGNETSPNTVSFQNVDVCCFFCILSRKHLTLMVYFFDSMHLHHAVQACSKVLPSPPLRPSTVLITAHLGNASLYHLLKFVSTAAFHLNNWLLLRMIPYGYLEWNNGYTVISSSELTGSPGGYDHMYTSLH